MINPHFKGRVNQEDVGPDVPRVMRTQLSGAFFSASVFGGVETLLAWNRIPPVKGVPLLSLSLRSF